MSDDPTSRATVLLARLREAILIAAGMQDKIDRLTRERDEARRALAIARAERDEARRMVCEMTAAREQGTPEGWAKEWGWDCYDAPACP